METTHIRITEELKQELEECEGQNFTEKVKNYSYTGQTDDVNTDVNPTEIVNQLKEELGQVNSSLTYDDVDTAIRSALEDMTIGPQGEVRLQ